MTRKVRHPSEELLHEVIDPKGRYDPSLFATFLKWEKKDIAAFLQKDPSGLRSSVELPRDQQALAKLAAAVKHLLHIAGEDAGHARAWLITPIQVLDGKAPRELIMRGDLAIVIELLDEIESGFAA